MTPYDAPPVEEKTFSLHDFPPASDGGPGYVPEPDELDAYTPEQISGFVAFLSSMGLPAAQIERYRSDLEAQLKPSYTMLQLGEALAKYGVSPSGGMADIPAWAQIGAAGLFTAYAVITSRAGVAKPRGGEPKDGASDTSDDPGNGFMDEEPDV